MKSTPSTVFRFRCPAAINAALESAAGTQLLTKSAYARRALLRSLQEDGAMSDQAEIPHPKAKAPGQRELA
jgi:hypothetical protein